MRAITILLGCGLALVGCARSGPPNLMNFPATSSANEFLILPTKPLEMPQNTAALPAPTPGGTNLTDPTPQADAIAALGGNRAAVGRASSDGGLLAYSTRYGVAPDIRSELAASDLEYRRANDGRPLERLFNVNVYYEAYAGQTLDQYRELERFRAAGIKTPAAPPRPTEQ